MTTGPDPTESDRDPPPGEAGGEPCDRPGGGPGEGLAAPISIVVPTFREAANIEPLLERIASIREVWPEEIEVIIVDDDSRDGTDECVRALGLSWVRLIVRTGDRGLSASVIDGFRAARHPVLVCMDADLSHPPERVPPLVRALLTPEEDGAVPTIAVGSRYAEGGSFDTDWGLFRWLNSKLATALARPLTAVRDPMSGFFAIRRSDFDRAAPLNPVGYKIALELIVKCRASRTAEVPIHFTDRARGESKMNAAQQAAYLKHLMRLYAFRLRDRGPGLGSV